MGTYETHDEGTLFRVLDALKDAGLDADQSLNAIRTMHNAGIVFREVHEDPEDTTISLAEAAMDAAMVYDGTTMTPMRDPAVVSGEQTVPQNPEVIATIPVPPPPPPVQPPN